MLQVIFVQLIRLCLNNMALVFRINGSGECAPNMWQTKGNYGSPMGVLGVLNECQFYPQVKNISL